MGTGNYVTTLSGRNQQSNLDKIDNWETTRKYLFDRIFLYTAYSLILQIYFQRKILYLLHLFTLNEEISNEKIIASGKNQEHGFSHCCRVAPMPHFKTQVLLIFFSLKGVMFTLKNTKEEFYDLLWKTPGRKRRKRPTTWRPFLSSPPSTMNDILWSATSLGSVSSWSTTLWSAASNEVHHQL